MQNKDHITALAKHFANDFLINHEKHKYNRTSSGCSNSIGDVEIDHFENYVNEKAKGPIFSQGVKFIMRSFDIFSYHK